MLSTITIEEHHVGQIGYGLMGFAMRKNITEEQTFSAMRAALEAGCNLWDGGIFYGTPDNNSLTLLSKYYAKYPEDASKVVLNIKGGFENRVPNSKPDFLRSEVEDCLKTLGGKGRINVFEPARRDPTVPLKESLGALDELVKEGKIGGVALSEVSAKTIREAAAITKIVAVEIELSLWHTEPLTNGITQACGDLDIALIAYSPLGRGILTGAIHSHSDLPPDDFRHMHPRYQPENFTTNIKLVRQLERLATKKGCTPAQLALGWIITLSKRENMPTIIPIPGATSVERVRENAGAVELTEEEMGEIQGVLGSHVVAGERYPPAFMKMVNG